MKHIVIKILAITTLALVFCIPSKASHIASAHMYADYISPNTYEYTLELYRDCGGIPGPSQVNVTIGGSCGSLPMATWQRDTSYIEQGALCPNVASTCVTPLSQYNGYEVHIYRGIVTFPYACTDWTVQWSNCCRNAAILNLAAASSSSLCIKTVLNTSYAPTNSTPRYLKLPIPYFCVNQPQTYVNLPWDPQGDSIQTNNYQPSGNCTSGLAYQGAFSLSNPINAAMPSGYVNVPETGDAHFTPTQIGAFALAFQTVEVDRNTGVFMSSVERDVQVNVVNCNTPPPTIDSFPVSGSPGLYSFVDSLVGGILTNPDPVIINICPGQQLVFKVQATSNSSTNNIYLTVDSLNLVAPGATVNALPSQGSSPIIGLFDWTPTASDIGDHPIVFTFTDSTCDSSLPIVLISDLTVNIRVLPGVEAGPDLDYCGNTSDTAIINATGPTTVTQWNWTNMATGLPPTDLAPVNSPNAKAWPSTTTAYILSTNANTSCKNSDTVVVEVHPPIPADAGVGTTICANENYQIVSNIGAYDSLLWTPNYNINSQTAVAPLVYPGLTTTYQLYVADTNGCTYHDSVTVSVNGVAPNLNAWAELDTICPDGTVPLHVQAQAQTCGLAQSACTGTSQTSTLNQGQTISSPILNPFNFSRTHVRSQWIITKAELNAMGLSGTTYIESLGWNVVSKGTPGAVMRNLRVKMACTGKEVFSTSDFDINVTDVVAFKDTVATTTGPNVINFDNAYYWDGETNLIFEVCFDGMPSSLAVTGDNVQMLLGGTNMFAYHIASGASVPSCQVGASGAINLRPKVTLGYCSEPDYTISWNPTTFLVPPSGTDPVATNVSQDPMSWTVTATSVANPNCKSSETITVYHDKSSTIDAKIYAPDYENGVWQDDSVVLCENPSIYYLEMDTVFGQPAYNCSGMNTICPQSLGYQLAPGSLTIQSPLHSPLAPIYKGKRSQYLISASELNAIGLQEGEIKSLAWNVAALNSSIPYKDFSIKMGCTAVDTLNQMQDNAGMATVFSTDAYSPKQGWDTFALQKHYGWDGVQNLLIEVCYWNGIGGAKQPVSSTDVLAYSIYGKNVSQSRMSDTSSSSPTEVCSHIPAGTYLSDDQKSRPNFRFEICKGVEPSYYWTPGGYINDTTKISTFGIGVDTKYIYAYAMGRNGCLLKDSVKVVAPQHNYRVSPKDTFICSTDIAEFNAGASEKATSYQWMPTTNVTNPTGETTQIYNPVGGTYPYEVIWTDDYGCKDTGNVVLNVWDTPVVVITPSIDTIKYGSSIELITTGGTYYSWSPIQFLDNPYSNVVTATPTDSTLFKVVSIDDNGCKGTNYSRIYIDYENTLFVPNAFTPNHDQTNDLFGIENLNYQEIQVFKVYDRWGEVVFDSDREGVQEWDGTYRGEPVSAGVYNYFIRVNFRNGKIEEFKGDVTLLR